MHLRIGVTANPPLFVMLVTGRATACLLSAHPPATLTVPPISSGYVPLDFLSAKGSAREPFATPLTGPAKVEPQAEPAPAPIRGPERANAAAAATVLGHYAEGAEPLSEEAAEKAVTWGRHQHFSKEKISAIQAATGAPATGQYDVATARAVAATQRLHGLFADGQAGLKTRQTLGVENGPAAKGAAVAKGKAAPAGQPPKEGVSVALYNKFNIDKTEKGDLEFERRADDYAKQYKAAGLRDEALVWNKSTPFQGLSALTSAIRGIHTALGEYVHQQGPPAKAQAAQPREQIQAPSMVAAATQMPSALEPAAKDDSEAEQPDRSTQIKHLAIFTHGMEYGIDTNPNKHTYADGLHKNHKGFPASNIPAFVKSVSEALTPDVSVQLYACSTGREEDQGKSSELEMPQEGERRGGDSFSAHLADELREKEHKESSVYAHINAKHTTENPYARVFGYEAGEEMGGKSMFDMLYPSEFTNGELLKLAPDLLSRSADEQEQLHGRMRAAMWRHYLDCIQGEHHRRDAGKDTVFGRRTYTGMEMFQDPSGTATKLQADFQSRWLTDERRADILRKLPSVKGRD